MKKILIASLVASIAMWIWGAVYWINPITNMAMNYVENDETAQAFIRENFPKSGTYFIPGMNTEMEKLTELHKKGPLAMVNVHLDGMAPMSPVIFVAGWVHMFLVSLLLGGLLWGFRDKFTRYRCRFMFSLVIGFFGAFLSEGSRLIWFYAPLPFTLVNFFYYLTVVAVAGLILAAMVKEKAVEE